MAKPRHEEFYYESLSTLGIYAQNTAASAEGAKRVYDEWADEYDKVTEDAGYVAYKLCTPLFDQTLQGIFGDSRKTLKILDVGAGTGAVGKVLQNLGYTNIDALDVSPKMLDEAKKLNIYQKLICAALTADPISDIASSEYDSLICVGTFVIGHVTQVALDEMLRLVKPGGIIGLTLRKDVYDDKETKKFAFREKMNDLEKEGKWKLVGCELIDYHTNMGNEKLAKCFSLMYQVLEK